MKKMKIRCIWCRKRFAKRHWKVKYCDHCADNQGLHTNTKTKLDTVVDRLDYYLLYKEERNTEFYENQLDVVFEKSLVEEINRQGYVNSWSLSQLIDKFGNVSSKLPNIPNNQCANEDIFLSFPNEEQEIIDRINELPPRP